MADERVAFRVSVLPGASLWFDGTYAALVCLALILLCVMAMRRHIRLRVALPTVILLAALAIGLETALSWNVVNIELVGTGCACRRHHPEGEGSRPLPGQQHHPAGGGKSAGKAGREDGGTSG